MKEYKIDLKHQLKSFRESIYILIWTIGTAFVVPFLVKDIDFLTMFVISILFWLITSVGMSLPFHINYLKTNWRTKLVVDNNANTIRLIEADQVFIYNFSEIRTTRFILGLPQR